MKVFLMTLTLTLAFSFNAFAQGPPRNPRILIAPKLSKAIFEKLEKPRNARSVTVGGLTCDVLSGFGGPSYNCHLAPGKWAEVEGAYTSTDALTAEALFIALKFKAISPPNSPKGRKVETKAILLDANHMLSCTKDTGTAVKGGKQVSCRIINGIAPIRIGQALDEINSFGRCLACEQSQI